jgi:hypothetical protein
MLGANSGNPLGYWEPRAALRLNHTILRRHHSSQYDPTLRLQEEGEFTAKEKAACVAEVAAYLSKLPTAPLVIIKDLQITALSGVWFEAADAAGFDIATVIAVRHPAEVMASMGALIQASPELSGALWLKYNLLAERQTRGLPRVFVEYSNLLDDWRREIVRVSEALGIDLSIQGEDAVAEFLQEDLHRQRHNGSMVDIFGTNWISAVYEAVRPGARDEPVDKAVLDRVFEAYRASEHSFRVAFSDFHEHDSSVPLRLVRPFVWKLIEVVAMAHRRRGTWA